MIFQLFILMFYFPVYCLPIALITKIDLGNVNTFLQVFLLLYSVLLFINKVKKIVNLQFRLIAIVIIISIYGFVVGNQPLVVKVLAIKFLLLPLLMSSIYLISDRNIAKFLEAGMYVQIANGIAVVLEFILGPTTLLKLGFVYGTNIRDFTGIIRFPGLTFTNYELGMFSSIMATLMYIMFRDYKNWTLGIRKKLIYLTFISSLICLLGSSSRSGILFLILSFIIHNIVIKRRYHILALGISLGTSLVLYGINTQIFLFSAQSSTSRFELWSSLLGTRSWIYGTGLGTTGSASNSTFANAFDRTFVDNQFIGVLIQFGVFGAVFFLAFIYFLMRAISKRDMSLVIAFLIISMFIEIYDYTIFMTIFYFYIFYMVSKDSQLRK